MNNKISIIILIFSFYISAFAEQKVLLRSPEVSKVDYLAFIESKSNYISFTDNYLFEKSKNSLHRLLNKKIKKAQARFFREDTEKVIESFESIVGLRFQQDWSNEDRKILHYSLLRLTQLDHRRSQKWLKASVEFAPDLKIDPELFSPKLLAKINQYKSSQQTLIWEPNESFNIFDLILINGNIHQHRHGKTYRLPQGKIRLSLLSNLMKPVHRILTGEEALLFKPHFTPMVVGNCHKAYFMQESERPSFSLFENDCLASDQKQKLSQLLPQNLQTQSLGFSLGASQAYYSKQSKNKVIKNKWLWLGIGAITSVVLLSNKKRNGKTIPSYKKN